MERMKVVCSGSLWQVPQMAQMEVDTQGTSNRPCVVCGVDSSFVPETFPAAMRLQASGATVLDFLINFSLLDPDSAVSSSRVQINEKLICRPCLDVVVSCDQWGIALNNGLSCLRRKITARRNVAAEPHTSVVTSHVDIPVKEEPFNVRKKGAPLPWETSSKL
jgi:hypothetical protein